MFGQRGFRDMPAERVADTQTDLQADMVIAIDSTSSRLGGR